MPMTDRLGIDAGGIGGLTAAIALRQKGFRVAVFEQAQRFARVGADINLTPNAVRALDGLQLGAALRKHAARPTHRISRMWDTGVETSRLAMSDEAEEKYGSPQLTLHRGDLMAALEAALPDDLICFGQRVVSIDRKDQHIELSFADGERQEVSLLIGADGIHSIVRKMLLGEEQPRFTGVVAFRAVIPTEKVAHLPNIGAFTKWWGPNPFSQIVTFPLSQGRETFVFATIGQESWTEESWTTQGSVEELRQLYADFHPEARSLLNACDQVLKTALYERDPLPRWCDARIALLGDACHPMLPFMAQGAGSAIEDAVMLSRCLGETDLDGVSALRLYEDLRLERTAQIQLGSRGNEWLKDGGNADWVYGYDVWRAPLDRASHSK